MQPLLEGEYELDGSYGGRERVTKFVKVGLECPVIGLERVEVAVLVVRCKQVVGLLVGLRMIDEYNIAEKISATMREHGRFPSGAIVDFLTNRGDINPQILGGRPKGTKSSNCGEINTPADIAPEVDKKDQENNEQSQRLNAMNSVLRVKTKGSSAQHRLFHRGGVLSLRNIGNEL